MSKFSSVLLLMPLMVTGQLKYSNFKINDRISMKIAENMIPIEVEADVSTYSRASLASFASDDGEAILGVNSNSMTWGEDDTSIIREFYRASFRSIFDQIAFSQDTIASINGREFLIFEFEGIIENDNVFGGKKNTNYYSYIQYTRYNDKVLLFNFGCKARMAAAWKNIARIMMESVKIKK
ncbi:MAG: hypothetical protein AAF789_00195 [Bacteroidota bacterium]